MTEHWLTAFFDVNNNQTATDVLEKLCQVDVCFTSRLEETARQTDIDHGPFLRMFKQCSISDIVSHPYTNIKLFPNIDFSPVCICIIG